MKSYANIAVVCIAAQLLTSLSHFNLPPLKWLFLLTPHINV